MAGQGRSEAFGPGNLTAAWCAQVGRLDGCPAGGAANWTVLLRWTPSKNTSFVLVANQSLRTPTLHNFHDYAKFARWFSFSNSSGDVVLGSTSTWGLNPTQNWRFGLCYLPVLTSDHEICPANETVSTVTLRALSPGGTMAGPTNLSARLNGTSVVVTWNYENATLAANFFRVAELSGAVCGSRPSLARWNATTWRYNVTDWNGTGKHTQASYTFGGSYPPKVKQVCVYVEAVNTSIGNGPNTIYPHGFPAKDFVLKVPKLRVSSQQGSTSRPAHR
ncbi:MAG TPA: hypothetical protein VEH10_01890 [Thermoplasmata archaeon]|nr:hypothetical protein [Thermoplasmata archaeon]